MKKNAVVTGGRKGIGYACAEELVNSGYHVIVTGRAATGECGSGMEYMQCDISCTEQISAFVSNVFCKHGRVDLLINNAGVAPKQRLDVLEATPESFDFVMSTNLKGTFFMCQCVANKMLEVKMNDQSYQPRIINISSISAYTASVNRAEYCISKAGISMVTSVFAARLAEHGIPVFEIRPGIIMTDMTEFVADKYNKMINDGLTPIKRMGQPQDVASCAAALASGSFDFATGQVINADGGFHLRRL